MQNYPPGYPQQPGYQPPPGQGYTQQPSYPPSPGYPTGAPQQPYGAASQSMQYGGFWIRFVAYIIDSAILFVANFIVGFVIGFIAAASAGLNGGNGSGATTGATVLIYVIAFASSLLYFVLLWANGATVGMRALKLQVVDAQTGQQIAYGKAFLRYIGFIISAIPCYLGLMWAGWDSRKQGWHDMIAGTVVVQRM